MLDKTILKNTENTFNLRRSIKVAEAKNKKNVKKTRQENLNTNKVDSTKKERGNKNMVRSSFIQQTS